MAAQPQAFAADAEIMRHLHRLLLGEIERAEQCHRGAIPEAGEIVKLAAQNPAEAPDRPRTKVLQEIVNGKSGFLLEVAGERYRLEPQCDLSEYGLEVLSKPDFVIWPWSARNKRRPIAVFCDGWAFHKDILRDDARKRSALVASGKFWVWSLTYEDVKLGREGEAKALHESASAVFSHNPSNTAR